MPALLPLRYTFSPMSIVSMSSRAPASLRICSVASIISGPIPSPWATVIAVEVDMRMETTKLPGSDREIKGKAPTIISESRIPFCASNLLGVE